MSIIDEKYKALILLLIVSFIIKLWVWYRTPVVNPDAFEYIEQAKLIYKGKISAAKNCGKKYLSLYHFFIPAFYNIFKDWVFSARALSFFFAVISVIPVFFSFLLITDETSAFLSSLMFAVNPFLCRMSSEVIKDQMFWFLLSLGLLFSLYWFQKRKLLYFFLSIFIFVLSSFTRIEGVLFLFLFPFFVVIQSNKRFYYIIYILSIIVLITVILFRTNFWDFYLAPRLKLMLSFKYFSIDNLLNISPHILGGILYIFSIPFFVLFFIGLKGLLPSLKRIEFKYLLMLGTFSIIFLTILFGFICFSRRYLVIFFFPYFLLIAPCISFIVNKWQNNVYKNKLVLLLSIFIIVTSFSYNIKERRKDCLVYKEAGDYISQQQYRSFVAVLTNDRRVDLYANRTSLTSFCDTKVLTNIKIFNLTKKEIISYLIKNQIKYVFWEKEKWQKEINFPFLILIKKWNEKDNIFKLYKVNIKNENLCNNSYKKCRKVPK